MYPSFTSHSTILSSSFSARHYQPSPTGEPHSNTYEKFLLTFSPLQQKPSSSFIFPTLVSEFCYQSRNHQKINISHALSLSLFLRSTPPRPKISPLWWILRNFNEMSIVYEISILYGVNFYAWHDIFIIFWSH